MPTRSARIGSVLVDSVSTQTVPAARARAASARTSSTDATRWYSPFSRTTSSVGDARSRTREWNSSSANTSRSFSRSGSSTRSASRSSSIGRSVRIVTSSFERTTSSRCSTNASRARLPVISSTCASTASTGPYASISLIAVFGPIPFAPGMLSDESPISAR